MNLYKVLEGRHVENGRVYSKGDVVETERELDKIFPRLTKFARVTPEDTEAEGGAGDGPAASAYGTDVTTLAISDGLPEHIRVFQKGSWFHVVDTSNGVALNGKALRSQELEEFLATIRAQLAEG